jgi:anti-anti-sigma factor
VASSGLRILLKAAQRLSTGGSLTVTNANDTILEVFRISGFASVITIE